MIRNKYSKADLINLLIKNNGNLRQSAREIEIAKSTFQEWVAKDEDLKEIADKLKKENRRDIIRESMLDYSPPKILLWDLETTPMQVYCWSLRQKYIPHNMIIEHTSIISGHYKWLGEDEVHNVSIIDYPNFKKDRRDDSEVVKALADVLRQADIIVAQNGDAFDSRVFNTRCIVNGVERVPDIPSVDTLKHFRKHFRFSSNKLDAVAEQLVNHNKLKTDFDLWRSILEKPDNEAIKSVEYMCKYGDKDVLLLEELYLAIRPYIHNHPNANLMIDSNIPVCPTCSSPDLKKYGFRYTRTGKKQRYLCNSCGSSPTSGMSIKKADIR